VLASSSLLTYLPGVLDRVKFTHALVGHAHLAMAGFTTSVAALVLHALLRDSAAAGALAAGRPFALWQAGSLSYVVAMVALGVLEAGDPGLLVRADPRVSALFALRGAAGLALFLAALGWFVAVARATARAGAALAPVDSAERLAA
jgi:cytochrome c oxidase cbb3-type subunit 1